MVTLWVCEKYSVAADLARVLFGGIASHSSPVIETKKGVRLAYTTGHAVEPAAPEVYDAAYKSWEHQDVAALVRGGFRLVPAPGKAGAVATIEKEIRKADELVVATDAGREGEMIAWEIIERAGACPTLYGQSRSGFAAESKPELMLKIAKPSGAAAERMRRIRQTLGERASSAAVVRAMKAASRDLDRHWATLPREIVEHAPIGTVNAPRRVAAHWACCRCRSRRCLDGDALQCRNHQRHPERSWDEGQ